MKEKRIGLFTGENIPTETPSDAPAVEETVADSGYSVKVNKSDLNVRNGAGKEHSVNKIINRDTVIEIVEEKDGWGRLKDGSGWVLLELTEKII